MAGKIKSRTDENTHFLTPKKFEEQIEAICVKCKSTRLESIFIWCTENEYDPEDVIQLINATPTLKQNLEIDGIENGLLKKKKSIF